MNLELKGKVALIAGASQGLGYAVALALAQEGAQVAICSRDAERINKAAQRIQQATQATVMAKAVDVTHPEKINQWITEVVKQWNTIHICITNTSGPASMPFMETNDENWQNAFNLTLMSAVRLSYAVIPFMQKQRWGRIIHICSASVKNPISNLIFSNSIRAAVVALGKTQANELAADGILVNSVLPDWTKTERVKELLEAHAKHQKMTTEEVYMTREAAIPLQRIANPEEIADPVVFLASERASFITGTTITIDGGETKVPF